MLPSPRPTSASFTTAVLAVLRRHLVSWQMAATLTQLARPTRPRRRAMTCANLDFHEHGAACTQAPRSCLFHRAVGGDLLDDVETLKLRMAECCRLAVARPCVRLTKGF